MNDDLHPIWFFMGFLLFPVGVPLCFAFVHILLAVADRIRHGPQPRK